MRSEITITQVAEFFANTLEIKTVEFINLKANKLYSASYSRGTYGRIFSKFVKDNFTGKINLNGCSTSLALEITEMLNKKGYDFVRGENITFAKI